MTVDCPVELVCLLVAYSYGHTQINRNSEDSLNCRLLVGYQSAMFFAVFYAALCVHSHNCRFHLQLILSSRLPDWLPACLNCVWQSFLLAIKTFFLSLSNTLSLSSRFHLQFQELHSSSGQITSTSRLVSHPPQTRSKEDRQRLFAIDLTWSLTARQHYLPHQGDDDDGHEHLRSTIA